MARVVRYGLLLLLRCNDFTPQLTQRGHYFGLTRGSQRFSDTLGQSGTKDALTLYSLVAALPE